MKRATPFVLFVFCPAIAALMTIRCGRFNPFPADVVFKLDNRTDTTFCYYPSPQDAATERCLQDVKAHSNTTWRLGCSSKGTEMITPTITTEDGEQWIYEGTASCNEWKDTGERFVIAKTSEEFVVIDPLGRVTMTPIQ
jgi:hypothetical protein